jgi:hypothetical protein
MRTLLERVTDFVVANPGRTLEEIARGVRSRTQYVRDVLSSEAFSASVRDENEYRSPQVYRLAPSGADALGRRQRKSQCDLIESFLLDGKVHTTADIHEACGYSRLNSRIAQLTGTDRKGGGGRGMILERGRYLDVPNGPHAYWYRFVGYLDGFGPSEAADTSARDATAPGVESAASDGPAQLDIGEAA